MYLDIKMFEMIACISFFRWQNFSLVQSQSIGRRQIECILNSLAKDKFLDWFKLKAFADDKIGWKIEIYSGKGRKYSRKRRKCW